MIECLEGGWERTRKYQRCRQPSWLWAGTWRFRYGGCLEDGRQGRGQDGIRARGRLSLQFLHGSVFPHPPLCSGGEAPIVPRAGGARSPGSHLHTAGGSLLCQGSQPRRYFIFSCSLRPQFSPGPASFREGSPEAFAEVQKSTSTKGGRATTQPPNLTTALWSSDTPFPGFVFVSL